MMQPVHMGEFLTSWTIRFALFGYFLALCGFVVSPAHPRLYSLTRWLWTLGCLFYLGHVVSAFHFYYDWSHRVALVDTARQTREVMDADFGYGIYMTYLFTVIWAGDVLWWWLRGEHGYLQRTKAISIAIQVFMLFIIANGAIVFEGGLVRWLSVMSMAGLAVLWWRFRVTAKARVMA